MPLTVPQLDDRNFEQLLAEVKARIPVHTPEWTNFASKSDPGMTVVDLFAFMTENLLYRSNRIPERNRQKFLTLLGVPLRAATAAQGLVAFGNERGPLQPWPLQAGVEVRAGKTPFLTRNAVCILPVTAHAFRKQPQPDLDEATKAQYRLVYETFLEGPADDLLYYKTAPLEAPEIGKPLPSVDLADGATGAIDGSLWVALVAPKGANKDTVRAAIAGQTLTLGIYPAPQCEGLSLEPLVSGNRPTLDPGLVFEIPGPTPDPTGKFGVGPANYRRLTVEYAEEVLERPGIVQVLLPEEKQLLLWDHAPGEEGTGDYPPLVEDRELAGRIITWVRVRLPKEGGKPEEGSKVTLTRRARLSWVGVNAARVTQALSITHERLGRGTGAPDQIVKVANTPVIVEPLSALPAAQAPGETGGFILEVENGSGGWDVWRRTDDLWAAQGSDPVYTLDPESGQVSFGDGLRGRRPPVNSNIRASYEYGGGPAGKVAIGAIGKSAALPGGFTVANPVPTWDGDPGETTAEGERNIARYLKHRDRLVTGSDFRDLTLRTPGVEVGRVEVLPLFHPEAFNPNAPDQTWPGVVTLLVIPRSDPVQPDAPVPDRLFLDAVCRWLDPRRLLTTEIFVRGPQYVPLYVSVGIATLPGHPREQVRRAVQAALRGYLSPLTGGPPVEGAASLAAGLDPACAETTAEACPTPRGAGWMLGSEVRRQDLEAAVTRVSGVRYVEGIQLGMLGAGGATLTNLAAVPIAGLQLPRLALLSVREGAPEDLAVLLGQKPVATLPNLVSAPVMPTTC
jgi:hypothetical protein